MTLCRLVVRYAAIFASLIATLPAALADSYPSRPITLIVPFPPGAVTDTTARIMADRMRAALGQPVIVENVGGAGGTIGVGRLARATPDGYTIGIGQWSSHVSAPAIFSVQYDVLKDFEPISLLPSSPLWIVGRADLPARNLNEMIAWLKANPQKATAGLAGNGSAGHICAIYFQRNTGTHFQLVPYRGGAPALQDLLAGHTDLMCGEASQSLAQVQSGKLKAFAVLTKSRWDAAPETPTIDEAGVPGLYISFWHGLWAPKGTPKDIIAKLDAAVIDALADPTVRQRFGMLGQDIPARAAQTPEALLALHKAEIDKWWPVIKSANIKVE